ncbi:MAG: hypothetical protein KBT06_00555 [Prevotellaceae bacterium]|nr:hypothetical protein [Candidatus Colivivens equi]
MRNYLKNKKNIAENIAAGVAQYFKLAKISEEEEDMVRWKKLNDIPKGFYRDEAKKLMDKGILKGKDDGTIDITEDMLRCMIFCQRIIDQK